jgi:sulfhydrogenase subunit delta
VATGPLPRAGDPGRLRQPLPGVTRGCYGCFGPMEAANTEPRRPLAALGVARPAIRDLFRSYNAAARPFRKRANGMS